MTQDTPTDKRQWVLDVLARYELPLVRYAARLLGSEEAARDVVQYAFLRLCRQPFEGLADRVAPWLFTVCRNRAVDLLRQASHSTSMGDNEPTQCVSREPDPAQAAERDDLYRRLVTLVEGLPPDQREAITLWCEGVEYRQIAQITGHTEGNVRVLVHRGLKRIRQHPLCRRLLDAPPPAPQTSATGIPL